MSNIASVASVSILGARVVDPSTGIDRVADVHLADGRILAVGDAPAGFRAERRIEAAGLVLAPGLVDLSARLREPGFEYKATLESEMQAAVAGGITSLVCPPDTDPILDEPGLIVPHPRLPQRRFVLEPLAELDPDLKPWRNCSDLRHEVTVGDLLPSVAEQKVRRVGGAEWADPRPT